MSTTANKHTHTHRATVEWYRGSQKYTVIDRHSGKIVIQTTSYGIADYWRTRVNHCEHPLHYDIVEHDHREEQWLQRQGVVE